jgi:hypothetical protein
MLILGDEKMQNSKLTPIIKTLKILPVVAVLSVPAIANAVVLVQTSDPGYYNDSLGTILNNTNGGDTPTGYFPASNDSSVDFPVAPDLSAASAILGNWLTDPLNLNFNWNLEAAIPNSWTAGTEVAVMYQFNTLGATNVVANFGVDNGIYAWLDGTYLGGARRAGGVSLGEHVFNVGDLTAGTHFLQLLLEDHGSASGYAVQITADTFIPGPPQGGSVPEPATLALLAIGIGGIGYQRRKKIKSALCSQIGY